MKRLALLTALLLVGVSASAGLTVKVAINFDGTVSTLYRAGEKAQGGAPPTGWTCAVKGDATIDCDEVSASSFTIVASGTNDEGNIAYVYKSEASDTDLQIEACTPSSWTGHIEPFTGFGVGITEGVGDAAYATQVWWPNSGTARIKSDAGGAGELEQSGASGQFLPRCKAITYDDSETSLCGYESDDAVTWSLIGACVTKSLTFPVLTYVFGTSHHPTLTTTATFTGIIFATTIDITDGGAPPAPTGSDHLIATGTTSFDCNANGVEPGDTVTLDGTARGPISFSNCYGDSGADITIRNDTTESGPLVITIASNSSGINLTGGQYYTIDGTGKWSGAPAGSCGVTVSGNNWTLGKTQCGIQIVWSSGDVAAGFLRLNGYNSDFTIKGVEIDGTGMAAYPSGGIGIQLNDHNIKLAANPGVWREEILYTQNYVHNVPASAIYSGPNWVQGDLRLRNIDFSYNIMEDTGRNGILLKSAVEGSNNISYNYVKNSGSGKPARSISLLESMANVFNNFVINEVGKHCINFNTNSALDLGSDQPIAIYSNVVVDCNLAGIRVYGAGANDFIPTVYNNTIVTTGSEGITISSNVNAGAQYETILLRPLAEYLFLLEQLKT